MSHSSNTASRATDADGSEGVMLHSDQTTGGMDLLVRFPAGHVRCEDALHLLPFLGWQVRFASGQVGQAIRDGI